MTASPAPLRIVRLLDRRPPVISPDDLVTDVRPSPYVQDSLALDFSRRMSGDDGDPQPTPRRDLPDPGPVVRQLAQAFVEVMAGLRPPQQVSRWTSPEVYAALCRRSVIAARRPKSSHRPARVRRVRIQEPADGVVEASAVVVHHDRVRAMAIRVEGIERRWVVTVLQLG
ncbi:MAG TPA: Rv3235 family protein [Dermatophilaceae bacterium]|nr:Rv3235 family protein [Dermatophilaceae bacterium]